ncbi:hypothetical protein K502DRAFT_319868 [Neoconidiobolus thromboides FSU 785]|nr:hypothetical protein K502DRAFT_319868 [Neoconidiobolus thromboides FSU 785]
MSKKNISTPSETKEIKITETDFDVEGKIPITSVQLEGIVLMNIIKHCRENFPSYSSGLLLGLDFNEVLEVTNSFAFPSVSENKSINAAQYRAEMIRHYREVNIDSTTVGWYVSSQLNDFLTSSFIETQASYQRSLGNKCVALVHDVSRSAIGSLHLRAYRLSDSFMELYQSNKFTSKSLSDSNLTFENILVEIPIIIHNPDIINAMLHELVDDSEVLEASLNTGPSIRFNTPALPSSSFISPNYGILDLNIEPYIERNLENLLESLEDYSNEQNNFQYHSRNLAREKSRIQSYLQSKHQENEARVARGQAPLILETEEQVYAKFKLPAEPSRFDSLLTNYQINSYCKQLNQFTGPTLTKMYATQGLQQSNNQQE